MTKADKRSLSEPRLRKFTPSNSAEDFIERAATQSSFSGRPYLVNCGGNERPSADWLKEELHLLRGGGDRKLCGGAGLASAPKGPK